jgi:multidrug efflux pump
VILLSVPLAVAGALLTLFALGESINVYAQVGMVLLIGLMAKNGILIVEFANQLRARGMAVREAVVEASAVRLRPIMMTVLSTVLGAVPLVISNGAGVESRFSIGIVIIGGFLAASTLTLFLTPVLYDLMQRDPTPRPDGRDRLDAVAGVLAE